MIAGFCYVFWLQVCCKLKSHMVLIIKIKPKHDDFGFMFANVFY